MMVSVQSPCLGVRRGYMMGSVKSPCLGVRRGGVVDDDVGYIDHLV